MIRDKNIQNKEKVVLAGLLTAGMDEVLFEEDIHEMHQLCETAGATVVATVIQRRSEIATGTYLGKGKLKEIRGIMESCGASTLVIDAQLTPGQIKAIEEIVQGKIVDRPQLILDIFAKHAHTAEARLQVELAQLRLLYPRLTHAWTHFSQQVGGIGTRGPGEKQLEVDRRVIQRRITDLQHRLKQIEKRRVIERSKRNSIFKAALVGYTNVGKSTIFNALCHSSVLVEDKLFATLDTTIRRSFIPRVGNIVVSDTVGLLRKLPHHLVASFKSTLMEAAEADLLLIVMDASSVWTENQMATVNEVLSDLKATEAWRLLIFNKIDLVEDPFKRKQLQLKWPDALFISAYSKEDIALLKSKIGEIVIEYNKQRQMENIISSTTKSYIKKE